MHFLNPQRGAHLGLTQLGATPQPMPEQVDEQAGIGSAQSGYATPENGPFECQNCIHFDGQGNCDHPQVISDPEVQGHVEAEGCCNLFRPSGQESQKEEHEEGAIPGAGEPLS